MQYYVFLFCIQQRKGKKLLETFQLNNRMLKSKEDVSMDKYY
ncbi:hypothetical protein bcere0007_16910 [Bacillus mycoides]|nr:hypothetical protein bcere0007_16910 [Bacillus mycoides]